MSIESERELAAQARAQAEQELRECQALEEELAHVRAVLANAGAALGSGSYDPAPLLRQSATCRELATAHQKCQAELESKAGVRLSDYEQAAR